MLKSNQMMLKIPFLQQTHSRSFQEGGISIDEHLDKMEEMKLDYEEQIQALKKQADNTWHQNKELFDETVARVEQKFLKSRSSPVCADLQAEVLKCYQENKTQPLQCSSIVKKFNDAVQVQREKLVMRHG